MLLFSGRCILQRFLGNLRLDRLLLTVVVTHPWFLSRSSRLRQPPPLPLPSRIGSGGVTRLRPLFGGSGCCGGKRKGAGKSLPDEVSPLLRVGGFLSAHWRHWQTIGADSWVLSVLRDGYRIAFLDSPPPPSRTPISFPTYGAGSPRSLACTRKSRRYCPRMPWKSSSVVEEAVEVSVGGDGDSLSVQDPVLRTVDCPLGLHQGVWRRVCVGALPQDSSSPVPGRLAGPRLFGGGGQKELSGSALALSLPRDRDKRKRSQILYPHRLETTSV